MLCCSILTFCPNKVRVKGTVVPVLNKPSNEGERTASYSGHFILKKEPSVTTGQDARLGPLPGWMWFKKNCPQPGIETQSIRTISGYNTSVIILILKMDNVLLIMEPTYKTEHEGMTGKIIYMNRI
jgi:hypothetical protein